MFRVISLVRLYFRKQDPRKYTKREPGDNTKKILQTREQVLSTRSVDLNLARRFNAGKGRTKSSRRVATLETNVNQSSLRDENS